MKFALVFTEPFIHNCLTEYDMDTYQNHLLEARYLDDQMKPINVCSQYNDNILYRGELIDDI